VLEEVDGEGMQNPMTGPNDFVVLLMITAIENVAKKSRHESNPLGKSIISKKFVAISPNKLENQKIGLNTRVDVGDFLTKVLSNVLLINNCEKEGSISIPVEFLYDFLKVKEDGKLLEATNLSNNVEIVANKEEATTSNKKHAKPPKVNCNVATAVQKTISTRSSQDEEVPI
jgi:hypothetical protein